MTTSFRTRVTCWPDAKPLSIQLGKRYLNVTIAAHSFNTFVKK